MSLPIGARLGPYEITAAIGAGGMGEVFRGRDAALNRDVAIKVLPAAMAAEPERLARFKREAQLLASLNHPNIAQIYGFDAATLPDGSMAHFLAMEMVEGEDLAERLRRGAIPVDEAIAIAQQVADGLEEAHERGIIHRDLKPANVKVTPDGKVKVLDFGLAKALEANAEASTTHSQLAQSPTISRHMTEAGMIMGTAAYMSPEQARGKPVDRRTDIWAFGVLLFEMLTGRRLFTGETVSDTLAAVLKTDPDWSLLPKDAPAAVTRLLRRCLERDTKRRLGWIGGFRHELDESGSHGNEAHTTLPPSPHPAWRRALPWAGAVLAGALLVVAFQGRTPWSQATRTPPQVTRLSLEGSEDVDAVAISPDGTRVALRRGRTLHLRRMGEFASTPIKIPNVPGLRDFVFSPDGESIAFTMGASLKRVPVSGDLITDIGELPDFSRGCSWSGSDIYCGVGAGGVVRIPAAGGEVQRVVTLSPGEHAATPQLLPDGDTLIFSLAPGGAFPDWTRAQIVAQSLSSGKREVVVPSGNDARYIAGGYLTWAVDGVWFGSAFDMKSRRTTGTPVSIIEGVARVTPGGQPSAQICLDVSATGTVVYGPGPAHAQSEKQIVFTDRAGRERVLRLPPDQYETPRVSPDGRRLAMSIVMQALNGVALAANRGQGLTITFMLGMALGPMFVDVLSAISPPSRNRLRASGPKEIWLAPEARLWSGRVPVPWSVLTGRQLAYVLASSLTSAITFTFTAIGMTFLVGGVAQSRVKGFYDKMTTGLSVMNATSESTYIASILVPLVAFGLPLSPIALTVGLPLFNAPPVYTTEPVSNLHTLLSPLQTLVYGLISVIVASVVTYPVVMRYARSASAWVMRNVAQEAVLSMFAGLVVVISYYEGGAVGIAIAVTVGVLGGVLNKIAGFNIAAQMMSYFAAPWIVKALFGVG